LKSECTRVGGASAGARQRSHPVVSVRASEPISSPKAAPRRNQPSRVRPRKPERCQADLRRVDGVERSEAFDHLAAQRGPDIRTAGQARRHRVADRDTRPVLDDLKGRAEHTRLGTEE